MKYDLVAIGDYLVDFTPFTDKQLPENLFETNVGGTAANPVICCAQFGLNTLAVGKLGKDTLGDIVYKLLREKNVDVSGIVFDEEAHATTHTMVTLKDGERSFDLYRKYSADILLDINDIDVDKVLMSKAISFTGMSFSDEPIKSTNLSILNMAKDKGVFRAIDVNYRKPLWKDEKTFQKTLLEIVHFFDFFKCSEEEAQLITGMEDVIEAARIISNMGPKLVSITCGERGAIYRYGDIEGHLNTYDTKKVDTTGAGDCFFAAMLYCIINRGGIEDMSKTELDEMTDFANAAGATSISIRGGAASMPTLEQVLFCQNHNSILVTEC